MKLWLIEQNERCSYDTYDSAVVAAETEDEARATHPQNGKPYDPGAESYEAWTYPYGSWATHPDNVRVSLIGDAVTNTEAGVVCASFNAG